MVLVASGSRYHRTRNAAAVCNTSIDPHNRIILHIGKQRVAFDISCQATVLNPAPVNQLGGKGRKTPKP
jgi:hypothetical protein